MMPPVQSLADAEIPLTELEDRPKLGTSQEGRESRAGGQARKENGADLLRPTLHEHTAGVPVASQWDAHHA